jgi:hypothetical protein
MTFSVVFETENLSSVELENVYRSLDSLSEQSVFLDQANEFLIIDGDYAPPEVIEEIKVKYPWVTVKKFPGIGYYEAKMKGAELATGDIIIYCDSDCVYSRDWLNNILNQFTEKPEINVIAGETVTPIRSIYELAIAVHYFFPRFSQENRPYSSNHYFLNNVAFRRKFLLEHPIPTGLSLYRSNCLLHAYCLTNLQKYQIWKHPEIRAIHEPPSPTFISWRYLLRGRDRVLREAIKSQVIENFSISKSPDLLPKIDLSLTDKIRGTISTLSSIKIANLPQIRSVLQEDISRFLWLPITIPYILWFELLYFIGSAITYWQPDLILNLYKRSESKLHESV